MKCIQNAIVLACLFVDDTREAKIVSFLFDKPLRGKVISEPESRKNKKVILSLLKIIAFYLEDYKKKVQLFGEKKLYLEVDENYSVDFNGDTKSSTLLLIIKQNLN